MLNQLQPYKNRLGEMELANTCIVDTFWKESYIFGWCNWKKANFTNFIYLNVIFVESLLFSMQWTSLKIWERIKF